MTQALTSGRLACEPPSRQRGPSGLELEVLLDSCVLYPHGLKDLFRKQPTNT
jgi:hypothetical protein